MSPTDAGSDGTDGLWAEYGAVGFHDELIRPDGTPRDRARVLAAHLAQIGIEELRVRQLAAEVEMRALGITFRVYDDDRGRDRTWPFDVVPRVIDGDEWRRIETGLEQRLRALNHFIADTYGDRKIYTDGVVPTDLLASSANHRPQCDGATPTHGTWAHICGSDLVRDRDGTVYVLEDNLRVPSGVSYMLENRAVAKRVFPELFRHSSIEPVDGYSARLFDMLASLAPWRDEPTVVVLTPGVWNSAYFEHAFLAQQLGVELVEGSDLLVDDDVVWMRTVEGLRRVDVIYRRVDDDFCDPDAFRADSTLGVRGLLRAWHAGNVAIANAPGTGVADDKVVYAYVPEMIRYYLGEEPKLPNVETMLCSDDRQRAHVLAHLGDYVLKPANESGGNGILIGEQATKAQREEWTRMVEGEPRNWVAQPLVSLSTAPTLHGGALEPRHVDLRPFILTGAEQYVTKGGLTRVAMRAGSYVVNSSQGGGSKDTWVIA